MAQYIKYNDKTFAVGDTIQVFHRVKEAGKERIQMFEGVLIAAKGHGSGKAITVRKIASANIGVERVWPILAPSIKDIIRKRRGKARRAKLYYLRNRTGKFALKVKDKKAKSEVKP